MYPHPSQAGDSSSAVDHRSESEGQVGQAGPEGHRNPEDHFDEGSD